MQCINMQKSKPDSRRNQRTAASVHFALRVSRRMVRRRLSSTARAPRQEHQCAERGLHRPAVASSSARKEAKSTPEAIIAGWWPITMSGGRRSFAGKPRINASSIAVYPEHRAAGSKNAVMCDRIAVFPICTLAKNPDGARRGAATAAARGRGTNSVGRARCAR